jgi:catechol 2,3-dioxygenase-like lactoylglutathione lyase family enzyme
MGYQIQVITVPVTDVDQAAAFYTQQAGFILDVDYHPAGGGSPAWGASRLPAGGGPPEPVIS